MPPIVVNAMDRVKSTVKEFSLAQKTLVIIGIAVLVLGGAVLYSWIGQPSYQVLYSGLTAKDQAAIKTQLDADNISYKLADGSIAVPSDKIYDARMSLAEKNLPSMPTEGYAILDNLGVASSDFQQQMASKRAIEGELAKTIRSLDGIKNAIVQLAIPKESVFADPKAKPATTASVTVLPAAGHTLNNTEVQGIIKMVSSSVPGLKSENVAVVDSTGKTLSDQVSGGGAAASDLQSRLEAQVLKIVEPMVGPGNARVSVTARMSEKTTETTSTTYSNPEGNVKPLSESAQNETYTGAGPAVGGVLGPDNIANPYNLNGKQGSKYDTDSKVVNNPINQQTTHTTEKPGAVLSKSVSVVLNQSAARRLDMNAVRDAVAAAVGIDQKAGDMIYVSRMPFDDTVAKERTKALRAARAEAEAAKTTAMIRQAVIAGLIILLLIIIAAIARRRAKKREREALDLGELDQLPEPYTLTPPQDEPIPLELESAENTDEVDAEPEEAEEEPVDPALLKLESKRQEIAELALDRPALVAEQLRVWMGGK